jgi:RNA-directed DNA polymerase
MSEKIKKQILTINRHKRAKRKRILRAYDLLSQENSQAKVKLTSTAIGTYWWRSINWEKCRLRVNKIQSAIYRNSSLGKINTILKLQRILISSYDARLLAVRKVCQENKGRRSAGIDGIKNVNLDFRFLLAHFLRPYGDSSAIRRVWIPKNKTEMRPLGIPTIWDRCVQYLVLQALEPEWEARFEPNSFGFRPGRSCHDAVYAIKTYLSRWQYGCYVLDADIRKCFDSISHERILNQINHSDPFIIKQVDAWLKAGILNEGEIIYPDEGTPQGGIISPLLANIALHGLEYTVQNYFSSPFLKQTAIDKRHLDVGPLVVRYADDFVVLHPNLYVVTCIKSHIVEWLKIQKTGLELHDGKTKISHTGNVMKKSKEPPGFVFLGFRFVHKRILYGTKKNRVFYNLNVTVNEKGINKHKETIKNIFKEGRSWSQGRLISTLSPVIYGVCEYWKYTNQSRLFNSLDAFVFEQCYKWITKRHKKKSSFDQLFRKYFRRYSEPYKGITGAVGLNKVKLRPSVWRFMTSEWNHKSDKPMHLLPKYVYICGTKATYTNPTIGYATPYDGATLFWALKPELEATQSISYLGYGNSINRARTYSYGGVNKMAMNQKGFCALCQEAFWGVGDDLKIVQNTEIPEHIRNLDLNTRFVRNKTMLLCSSCFVKLNNCIDNETEQLIMPSDENQSSARNIAKATLAGTTGYSYHMKAKKKLNQIIADIDPNDRNYLNGFLAFIKKYYNKTLIDKKQKTKIKNIKHE